MALHKRNVELERLVEEILHLTDKTKTEAIRRSFAERSQCLAHRQVLDQPATRVRAFLEHEVWPEVPEEERGQRLTSTEEDELLGYGEALPYEHEFQRS